MGSPSAHDGTRSSSSAPRAVIHKRILDVAEAQPNASMERIASEVSGASVDLVEQVLEEYGDPASESSEAAETADPSERVAEAGTAVDSASGAAASEDAQEPTGSTQEADESATDADVVPEESAEPTQDADAVAEEPTEDAEESADPDESAESDVTDGPTEGADDSMDGEPSANAGQSDADGRASERTGAAVAREAIPSDDTGSDDAGPVTDPAELTPKQRETFRLIYERPDAPQQEIADALGVTRATVSRRVNDADGFDWDDRRAFVARLFDGEPAPADGVAAAHERGDRFVAGRTATSDGGSHRASDDERDGGAEPLRSPATGSHAAADEQALADAIDDLTERVARLEDAVEGESPDGDCGTLADADLAHKVVHACMDAEYVTEDEELRVLKSILGDD